MGIYKKGNDWYIDYYYMGRRKREKIGPNKTLATRALYKRKSQIVENKFFDVRSKQKIKFEDFVPTYLELHSRLNKKPLVVRRDEGLIKNLSTHFAGKYLFSIVPEAIEKYKAERSKQVSPATVNRELACLKSIYNKAIEWGKADENPVRKVKFFRENNQRIRYLEKDEIRKLVDYCPEDLKSLVIIALNTGMRKGEILNLKWSDIDLDKGIFYLLDTKNNEPREVQMNQQAREALDGIAKIPGSPYVFRDEQGNLSIYNMRKKFETALKKSGIINFRFHDLRHTFASHLAMLGIDLKTMQELMGHKTIEMTLRYAHLSPDHKRRAVESLGQRMDTNWTPEQKSVESNKTADLQKPLWISKLRIDGGVAERSNAAVLKTVVPLRGPWVRILPPPPE